ncbi:MAG: DUF3999 domain-containing protein [Burkholderiaceae bacterium]|nr:DUF3999 domain-containing protein [Burkholderiaceae bacterium]
MKRIPILRLVIALFICKAGILVPAAFAQHQAQDYALRFELKSLSGAGLQRLALPSEALAALQTANASDLRIFNGAGQTVPVALVPARPAVSVSEPISWPIYPIMSRVPEEGNSTGMQLRITESAGQRIVQVDTPSSNTVVSAGSNSRQIGVLVDTKALKATLAELNVDAQLAPGQPVPLSVSASHDLKTWRVLAQEVPVFRFGELKANSNAPGSLRVPLNNAQVDKEYLRITWPANASFNLQGVTLTQAASVQALPRIGLPVTELISQNTTELIFSLPFASPILALELRAQTSNVLVPLRISGRTQRGEPWRLLASGVMYRLSEGNKEAYSPAIELPGHSVRELKIEAEQTSSGLAGPLPQVTALVAPVEIVFVATGQSPFTLAVGRAGAENVALPIASLIPGYTPGAEEKLPRIELSKALPQTKTAATVIKNSLSVPSTRSLVLWGVLIGGVLALGAIAWALTRQLKPPTDQ